MGDMRLCGVPLMRVTKGCTKVYAERPCMETACFLQTNNLVHAVAYLEYLFRVFVRSSNVCINANNLRNY